MISVEHQACVGDEPVCRKNCSLQNRRQRHVSCGQYVPQQSFSYRLHRELRVCKEGGYFGADYLSVLVANMSGPTARVEGEIRFIRNDSSEDNSISSFLRRCRFLLPFYSEFTELINVGAAKGWVRYLRERDLSDELSSVTEDGWLKFSVKITLVNDKAFRNALPPIIGLLPSHSLPKIDNRTAIQHQSINRFLRTAIT